MMLVLVQLMRAQYSRSSLRRMRVPALRLAKRVYRVSGNSFQIKLVITVSQFLGALPKALARVAVDAATLAATLFRASDFHPDSSAASECYSSLLRFPHHWFICSRRTHWSPCWRFMAGCTSFRLHSAKQKQIADEPDKPPGEVAKKLEDMRNRLM